MWTLTGFADEIADDFGEQLDLLDSLGIRHVELRSAWGVKVLDLDDKQLGEAKARLDAAGVTVSSVGSPMGKILVTDPFEPHLARMRHAVRVAEHFETPNCRVFSFFIPEGSDPDRFRAEVLRRMSALVEIAEASGVTLLHENEKDIYGDIPRRCVDLVESVGSPNLRLILDPANYVQCGVRPVTEAYAAVRPYTAYIHVKDALLATGDVRPSGQGDGQIPELLAALVADGYDGYFSIEPHLGQFDAFGGLRGPELWSSAHSAFTSILADQGIAWC